MLAFRAICLFDSPAATNRAISASRGVSSFLITKARDWLGWLVSASFSSAGRPRFRTSKGECRFGTGKVPRKKPAGGGRRAQSARSRQGGAKDLGVTFRSEASVVSLISWRSPYPVSLPRRGGAGPRYGEVEGRPRSGRGKGSSDVSREASLRVAVLTANENR